MKNRPTIDIEYVGDYANDEGWIPVARQEEIEQFEAYCDYLESENERDRKNLEWLVKECIDIGMISMSRGRELLGFQYMEDMRKWYGGGNVEKKRDL